MGIPEYNHVGLSSWRKKSTVAINFLSFIFYREESANPLVVDHHRLLVSCKAPNGSKPIPPTASLPNHSNNFSVGEQFKCGAYPASKSIAMGPSSNPFMADHR